MGKVGVKEKRKRTISDIILPGEVHLEGGDNGGQGSRSAEGNDPDGQVKQLFDGGAGLGIQEAVLGSCPHGSVEEAEG